VELLRLFFEGMLFVNHYQIQSTQTLYFRLKMNV